MFDAGPPLPGPVVAGAHPTINGKKIDYLVEHSEVMTSYDSEPEIAKVCMRGKKTTSVRVAQRIPTAV